MLNSRNKIKLFAVSFILAMAVANSANAALVVCGTSDTQPCKIGDLIDNVFLIVNFLVGSATLVAIGFIVYGGLRMILAAGDPGQIKSAKDTMTNAVLGLVIVLMSYIIVSSVVAYLTGYSLQNLRLFFKF